MPGPFPVRAAAVQRPAGASKAGEAWIPAQGVHLPVMAQVQLEVEVQRLFEATEPGKGPVPLTQRAPRLREVHHRVYGERLVLAGLAVRAQQETSGTGPVAGRGERNRQSGHRADVLRTRATQALRRPELELLGARGFAPAERREPRHDEPARWSGPARWRCRPRQPHCRNAGTRGARSKGSSASRQTSGAAGRPGARRRLPLPGCQPQTGRTHTRSRRRHRSGRSGARAALP